MGCGVSAPASVADGTIAESSLTPVSSKRFGPLTGLTADGSVRAGAVDAAFVAVKVPNAPDITECINPGTLAEFATSRAADAALQPQLINKVRKCEVPGCGKPCGFTMKTCNNCGAPLPEQTVHTDNIFMAFVYGVEKGERFPYNISIRKQTETLLVFDDPLALAALHFCAIPTTLWCADWRLLLRAPAAGLALIRTLEDAAWSVVEEQFLANDAWAKKHIAPAMLPSTAAGRAALREKIVCGCNFPPSQFQLHVQYWLLPWVPQQYRAFLDGNALVPRRWFPLQYIKDVLALDDPMDVALETPLDDVFAKYDSRVSYQAAFDHEVSRCEAAHCEMGNWQPQDFAAVVPVGTDEIVPPVEGQGSGKMLIEADKKVIQSNGPTKTYYKFPRAERVPEFGV